jgi:ABC-2 type transport system ATP-binding protein
MVPERSERIRAVDGIDLCIEAGEIFGLPGPNGAGKTTTVKVLATPLQPAGGTVRVLGIDALAEPVAVRKRLDVVLGGGRTAYWKLTGRQNLAYYALYHLPRQIARGRIDDLLIAGDLGNRADDRVCYSTGMRQRLVLARALLDRGIL